MKVGLRRVSPGLNGTEIRVVNWYNLLGCVQQMGKPRMFIVIEGPEGSGKSTLASNVADWLRRQAKDVLLVRDPGGTRIGEKIRAVLLDKKNMAMCPGTELLLYVAARAQLLGELIQPALDRGVIVVSDRFTLSTFAYQSVTGGWDADMLRRLITAPYCHRQPDVMFYLDIPIEVGFARMKAVRKKLDRIESKGRMFHHQVHNAYKRFALSEFKDVLRIVDASRAGDDVCDEVCAAIQERLDA